MKTWEWKRYGNRTIASVTDSADTSVSIEARVSQSLLALIGGDHA